MERDRPHPDAGSARRSGGISPVARRSKLLHRFMVSYFERYFMRHMNAMRIATWGMPAIPSPRGPLVVYSNHPAWWDAAVYILAADRLVPTYESYAPIDAEMLAKYGIFGRIGAFGVDLRSPRGAAAFISSSSEILSRPERALWIAAQGRFADVRERPLAIKPGIAHVPEIAPEATFIPLAIEYGFWRERGAEACMAFGEPLGGRDLLALPRAARRSRLEDALTATLDRLSRDVQTQDPSRFTAVIEGRAGIGGAYDAWRRLAAALSGRSFDPSHARRSA